MTAISTKPCAFCTLPSARVIDENATTIAVRDGYPVSPGHALLIPKRHTGSFFDLSEQRAWLRQIAAFHWHVFCPFGPKTPIFDLERQRIMNKS